MLHGTRQSITTSQMLAVWVGKEEEETCFFFLESADQMCPDGQM